MRLETVDAFVVTHLPNIFYLSNFAASAATAVVAPSRLYLITDFRYSAAVRSLLDSADAPPDAELVLIDGSYDAALARLLEGPVAGERYAIEGAHMTVRQFRALESHLAQSATRGASSLVSVEGVVEQLRAIKDEGELDIFRRAGALLSEVATAMIGERVVAAGRTEMEIAADIDYRMKRAGFERPAFDTIVAAGPNGAFPHAHPTSRRVEAGELVVADFGGVLDGYAVDLTRTVAVGSVGTRERAMYRAVVDSQRDALAAMRAGVQSDAVDDAARVVLRREGLDDAFGHGLGHGLGLEIHEDPRIAKRKADGPPPVALEAGMVVTVEPGVYVPGVGGVRIEDDVIVTTSGVEQITHVPLETGLL
jgi:Xaa-Pro aminopeptidase